MFLLTEIGFLWYSMLVTMKIGNVCLHVPEVLIYKDVGGAGMRVKVTLACTECKQRNYDTMKNKKNNPDRLEMDKYCKFCKTHTPHKETK